MCSVVRCDSSRRSAQRYILPEDPEKRLQWVQFVFEVNGQRLKESSWTEITICGEHFTHDCFEYTNSSGLAQLKPGSVPSLCVKSEPEDPEPVHVMLEEPGPGDVKVEEPEPVHVMLEELGPGDVKVEEPEPVQVMLDELGPGDVKVEEPEPVHVMLEELGPGDVKVEEPEPVQVMFEEPGPGDVKVEEPEPVHVMLEEPGPGDVKVEEPEPDRVILEEPEPGDLKVEEPEPDHIKVEQPEPEHVKVEKPWPEHANPPEEELVNPPEAEHVNPESVEPEEFVVNTGDTESDSPDESSIDIPVSPVSSDTSVVSTFDYDQMLQKIENIDVIKKKVALLQMKRKYVVNEKRLLQLFSRKCPLCGSKVKIEKVKFDLFIVIDQQCLKCEYGKHWKNQVSTTVPSAVDLGISEVVSEESDFMDDTEESSDQSDVDSDDEWVPTQGFSSDELLQIDSDEESEDDELEEKAPPGHCQLCVECGKFYNKQPHICDHKLKPYSCNICGTRCVSEAAVILHSRIHNENYVHQCKYCHTTFKTKVDKITHEQIHLTEKKPYKCSECSETFAASKKRQVHMKNHIDPEQGLKCHICGMKFYMSNHFKRHLIVHTGLKPFKCSVCQRSFNQASHLKSHMRLHTGERPYKCQHCDKSFNHNVSLKSHVLRYHTSNSEQRHNNSVSNTMDSQSVSKRGTGSGLYDTEEEQDREELAEEERIRKPKRKRKTTGRPMGRPKKNSAGNLGLAGENRGCGSNSRFRKSKVRKLNRTQLTDEESEDELTEGNISSDSKEKEEDERSERVTLNTSRSKGKPKKSDIDTDFDPEVSKKKRHSNKNSGKNSGKRHRGKQKTNKQDTDIEMETN